MSIQLTTDNRDMAAIADYQQDRIDALRRALTQSEAENRALRLENDEYQRTIADLILRRGRG